MASNLLLRIDLQNKPDQPEEIEITKSVEDAVHNLFLGEDDILHRNVRAIFWKAALFQVVPGFDDGATLRAKFRDRISDFVQRMPFSLRHHALKIAPRARHDFD